MDHLLLEPVRGFSVGKRARPNFGNPDAGRMEPE
jgi:hypothetical protein